MAKGIVMTTVYCERRVTAMVWSARAASRGRMMRQIIMCIGSFFSLCLCGFSARGAEGKVDWVTQKLSVGTSAMPSTDKIPSLANLHEGQRRARAMAVQALFDLLSNLPVDHRHQVRSFVQTSKKLRWALEKTLDTHQTVSTTYNDNGRVDVVTQIDLNILASELLLNSVQKVSARTENLRGEKYTGVVVDARLAGVQPALLPRLLTQSDRLIYDVAWSPRDIVRRQGGCGYESSVSRAKQASRVGQNPLIVKAQVKTGQKIDLYLNGAHTTAVEANLNLLEKGALMIVVDFEQTGMHETLE
jgi:hypothetical protein